MHLLCNEETLRKYAQYMSLLSVTRFTSVSLVLSSLFVDKVVEEKVLVQPKFIPTGPIKDPIARGKPQWN